MTTASDSSSFASSPEGVASVLARYPGPECAPAPVSRIPAYDGNGVEWALALHAAGLSFHFEDDPRDIEDGNGPVFTIEECNELVREVEAVDLVSKLSAL